MLIIVILSGKAESGKDTFFEIVSKDIKHHDIKRYSLGDEVKLIAKIIGWDGNKDIRGITFLQSISQCAIIYDENIWTKKLLEHAQRQESFNDCSKLAFLVITDCRYENQLNYILDNFQMTYTIRIDRLCHVSKLTQEQLSHQSEIDLDNFTQWDFRIQNDGNMEQYRSNVLGVMKTIISKYSKLTVI